MRIAVRAGRVLCQLGTVWKGVLPMRASAVRTSACAVVVLWCGVSFAQDKPNEKIAATVVKPFQLGRLNKILQGIVIYAHVVPQPPPRIREQATRTHSPKI